MPELNPFEYFLCGGFGGVCTVLSGHPLDTVKVRLQTGGDKYVGTWDCISKTVKNEGVAGLYKGITAPLTSVVPMFAMSFFGYGVGAKVFSADKPGAGPERMFGAGSFSGIFTTIIATPAERIKCLLQVQMGRGEKKYNGTVDAAAKLFKEGGIRSLYKGTALTLLRDVPAAGTYFLTYNWTTRHFTAPGEAVGVLLTIFAGGMAGITHWIVGMPADVLKSRLQIAPEGKYPRGGRDIFMELMKNEGPSAMYKGIVPVMLRAFPANAACFVGFEFLANVLRKIHGE